MQARKVAQCSHHVFTASALMELHVNKDPKVAFNIFSLGMKQFGANPDYVCAFLDFLMSQNDHASAYPSPSPLHLRIISLFLTLKRSFGCHDR
jgi:hypothetical protein